jgi:polyisoprenoid-binding protein YceI
MRFGVIGPLAPNSAFSVRGPGLAATAEINRSDFGIKLALPIPGGGVVVGDTVSITLEIEAKLAE